MAKMNLTVGLLLLLLLPLLFGNGGSSRANKRDICDGKLERALDSLHRDSMKRNKLGQMKRLSHEPGVFYQRELRSAPLEMSVSRIIVKLGESARESEVPWAQVEWCVYESSNSSLQTRVVFTDLSVSGKVSLMPKNRQPASGILATETCQMTLRLRTAGIDFVTSPIARARGQMRIRTESSFLEPRFTSIYAYGCHRTRLDRQIKRQDKWTSSPPPPPLHAWSTSRPTSTTLYSFRDEYALQPLAGNGNNYEAAEPRQLFTLSKEADMDIAIANQSSRSSEQPSPLARRTFRQKLGIWQKNVWITKSELPSRTLPPVPVSRTARSSPTITPQDFAMAIANKAMEKRMKKNLNLQPRIAVPTNETHNSTTESSLVRVPRTSKSTSNTVERKNTVEETGEPFLRHRQFSGLARRLHMSKLNSDIFPDLETEPEVHSEAEHDHPDYTTDYYPEHDPVPEFDPDPGSRPETNLRPDSEGYPQPGEVERAPVPEYVFDDKTSQQAKEEILREMEDVFLFGASEALTRYIEKRLHPAIKETLLLSMGYTISYG